MIIMLKHVITKLISVFKWPWLRLNPFLIGLLALVVVSVAWKVRIIDEPEAVDMPRKLRGLLRYRKGYTVPAVVRNPRQLDELAALIGRLNYDAELFNCRLWGRLQPDTDVILVQVHKDIERLQYLIIALGQVERVHRTLLIFSHSYYDDRINNLIRSIRFARVMQIFYPYSVQLNPDKFPGTDSGDCNDSFVCVGRNARRAERKHHWWWKAHYVFNSLDWSKKHRGMVIFLEEDDYVFPDILNLLKYGKQALSYFTSAHLISFGRLWAQDLDYDMFTVDTWRPPYDRGLTLNRTTWLKIANLASHFCLYDDASWSYSLVHLFEQFPRGYAEMVATAAPRVITTGTFASGRAAAAWRARAVAGARGRLHPRLVHAAVLFGPAGPARHEWRPPPRGNGGWDDLRDHMLCLDPLLATTTDTVTMTTYMFEQSTKNNSFIT